jgi:sugar phosphate permease
MLTAPVSGAIIAALDWRWLFIIEGLLSLVVLAVWWFMISDRPGSALAAGGRAPLSGDHAGRRAGGKAGGRCGEQSAGQRCFPQSGLMKLVILNFFYQTGDYGYTLWLPTILKG